MAHLLQFNYERQELKLGLHEKGRAQKTERRRRAKA
jgi:hypothetical protein